MTRLFDKPALTHAEQVERLRQRGMAVDSQTDVWYMPDSIKTSCEVTFTRYFYKLQPSRTLEETRADILALERETEGLLTTIASGRVSTEV